MLLVDFKFDAVRNVQKELLKVTLEDKHKKMLKTHALSIINVINDYSPSVNYDELDKIFNKTVKDLRGRKFLDEKEANALVENVIGGPSMGTGVAVPDAEKSPTLPGARKEAPAPAKPTNSGSKNFIIPTTLTDISATEQPVEVNPFDDKMDALTSAMKELKSNIEQNSKTSENATKYSVLASNLKELITSFEQAMIKQEQGDQADELEDSPGQFSSKMRETLGEIKETFKGIEGRYVDLAKLAGDTEGTNKQEINR